MSETIVNQLHKNQRHSYDERPERFSIRVRNDECEEDYRQRYIEQRKSIGKRRALQHVMLPAIADGEFDRVSCKKTGEGSRAD
jgi:hypothetical protein